MNIHNQTAYDSNPHFQLSGGGIAQNEEVVDALGNLIIGGISIFVLSWSFVSMFADKMLSPCGSNMDLCWKRVPLDAYHLVDNRNGLQLDPLHWSHSVQLHRSIKHSHCSSPFTSIL